MNAIFDFIYKILDILPFDFIKPLFMKNAFLALLFITPSAAVLGIPLTSMRMSFFSDSIAHSAFAGAAIGLLLNINPVAGIVIFAVIIGVSILQMQNMTKMPMDSIISVIMSASIAVGLSIVSFYPKLAREYQKYIFGDILIVGQTDIAMLFFVFIFISGVIAYTFNDLILYSYTPYILYEKKKNIQIKKILFAVSVAITTSLSVKIIGVLLVSSIIICPSLVSKIISKNTKNLVFITLIVSFAASFSALTVSYYISVASGALIVMILVLCFVFCSFYKILNRKHI